ncbi:hypothetical protein HXX02_11600 [Microbulbifer elongatus]|uniref:Lipoprotein n=1 Tax=Microbulbifer elongatus TaxID=86173 RepID=A0ABT1P1V0_9GAMM|nr:hypothetical protein [Microbulbifer elongatus]MCQ3830094.1 hypothetical protein [Microbulbifer elongatus]
MKLYRLIGTVAIPFISLMGCAEEGSAKGPAARSEVTEVSDPTKSLSTELKGDGEILSIKREADGVIRASYFFSEPPSKEKLAVRILSMMESVGINDEFIQKISGRIKRSRAIDKENFSLPLTDMDGRVYSFSFSSDTENSLFVINYSSK